MKVGFFLLGLILFSGIVMGGSIENDFDKVASKSVVKDFESGADKVKVVLKMSDKLKLEGKATEKESREAAPEYVVKEISLKELENLEADPNVEGIFSENHLHAFLGESRGIVDSDLSNNLIASGLNLSGTGQTVCVIDSGVNFSHPDIAGKNASCVVNCFDKACVENCSIGDDNGHGTHVAGIVGASGGITGMAPNVSLIGVKILDSGGDGSGNNNDLSNAIDWCVGQNVNVITMSLGTANLFDSACDALIPEWASSIDAAVAENISVVVASGNDANYTHISAPACMSNVIAVGDTYDANLGSVDWIGTCTDSTTALDKIVCHANRNSLMSLFAPGAMINSTSSAGGYEQMGGTSMATPMVAGIIALVGQYLNLSGQTKTPSEIEVVLNSTGEVLDDTANSGSNFSRVNVYDALLSLDLDSPNVTLVSPANNHVNLSANYSFNCNVSDWQLSNVTFKIWNSSGLYYNESKNLTGTENATSFNLTNMAQDGYKWNCFSEDSLGNLGSASSNFSLTVGGVEVSLDSPANTSYTNVNETNFTCSARSDSAYDLDNMTFYLWNSSDVLIKNETKNISGTSNSTVFNYTFLVEDDYHWECVAYNNNSDEGDGINFSIGFDETAPVISGLDESVTTSSATISWTTGEAGNSSVWVSGGSWSNSSSYVTSHSISVSSLSASTSYDYVVYSCDVVGNCANDSGSFTTSTEIVTSSGGGGGSGPTAKVVDVKDAELWDGKSELLAVDDKMNFNLVSGKHTLSVSKVGANFAEIIVTSDPVYLNLSVGEEAKLNLSSVDYYDLIVRLNSILNGKANVSVTRIYEKMKAEEIPEEINKSNESVEDDRVFRITDKEERNWTTRGLLILIGTVVSGILLWSLLRNRKAVKEEKSSKKKHGKKSKKTKAKTKR